jgi:hypothetical protein
LAEWIYEEGIGENRAALVDDGDIIEACIEPQSIGARAGTITTARLRANRIAELESGEEALLDFVPKALTEGARMMIEISRESLSEPGKPKRAKAKPLPIESEARAGPSLFERISAGSDPVSVLLPHAPDRLEQAGWTECLEQADSGEVAGLNHALRISLTPAMTLIDVDGTCPPFALAMEGAKAAGAAITRFGLAGSIGLDLPTLSDKVERLLAATAFRGTVQQPYEATALNGFGFMQIIIPRKRASLCELLQYDRPAAQARALLRRAQRSGFTGAMTLVVPPRVEIVLARHPEWLDLLSKQCGGRVALRVDPQLSIISAYVEG